MSDPMNEPGGSASPLTLRKTTASPSGTAGGNGPFVDDGSFVDETGPRIRWAGIIWGLIVSAIAVGVLAVTGSPFGRTAFLDWAAGLTAATVWLLVVLVVGGLLLVLGLLALLRRRA